jgi:hypothetical protein
MSKLYKFDFTLSAEICDDYRTIKKLLEEFCKTGTFQKEESADTNYLHYQGRISLKTKLTLGQLIKATPLTLKGVHWSPTSNNCEDDSYVHKEYTRVDGPWDLHEVEIVKTRQLLDFEKHELYAWQKRVKESCGIYNDRNINMVYDPNGNIGKSIFCEYLEWNNLAEEIPPFRLMDDIFQWVYSYHSKPAYFIDLPRGMKKDKLGDFYSGIEIIKNGVCYDKRYTGRKKRFTRPCIWIFSNMLPCFTLMSSDRWRVWTVNTESLDLEPYDIAQAMV